MPGCNKRPRKKNVSNGSKAGRAGRQMERRGPAIGNQAQASFLKHQADNRWPEQAVLDKYAELNAKKHQPSRQIKKPNRLGFPLMEQAMHGINGTVIVGKLLTAACLKFKRVKRHPGWILETTYNMKGRPIEVI